MMKALLLLCCLVYMSECYSSPWGYSCQGSVCKRQLREGRDLLSLEACSLICPAGNSLWPLPTTLSLSSSVARVHPQLMFSNIQASLIFGTPKGPSSICAHGHSLTHSQKGKYLS